MGHHHTHASRGGVGGLGLAAAVPALLDRATNRPPMTSRIPTSCGSEARREVRDHLPLCRKHGGR
ncbi:hypothetical protein SETIT_5G163200v2 [Setaria italica]|uniref:Uncharacterized protein n=1 Tax=Setaria italica TaxID=4555 RepID=A0A368R5D9_SETIT|nr:hypothetical protein SETIT_5G163200v2 [Setaria italica]